MSFTSGVSSDKISVPHVPLTSVRLSRPSGAATTSPTPMALCLRKLGESGATCSRQDVGDRLDHYRDVHDRNPRAREHPSLGAEIVLHVDDDHRRRPGSIARGSGLASTTMVP